MIVQPVIVSVPETEIVALQGTDLQPLEVYAPVSAMRAQAHSAQSVTDRIASLPPYYEQSEAAFASGRYDEARRFALRALLASPEDPRAHLNYGLAHFAIGGYSVAADAFRRVLEADPDLFDLFPDIRTAYGVDGDFHRHLGALERYLEKMPDRADAWFLLGLVQYSADDLHDAIASLSRALYGKPDDTVAYLLRDAALWSLQPERSNEPVTIRPTETP